MDGNEHIFCQHTIIVKCHCVARFCKLLWSFARCGSILINVATFVEVVLNWNCDTFLSCFCLVKCKLLILFSIYSTHVFLLHSFDSTRWGWQTYCTFTSPTCWRSSSPLGFLQVLLSTLLPELPCCLSVPWTPPQIYLHVCKQPLRGPHSFCFSIKQTWRGNLLINERVIHAYGSVFRLATSQSLRLSQTSHRGLSQLTAHSPSTHPAEPSAAPWLQHHLIHQ